MKLLGILTYILLIVVLALATIVERLYGTAAAHEYIYSAPWFYSLWAVLAMGGVFAIIHTRMWHRPVMLLLHVSFLVILLGALLTSLFSSEQVLHLREGESTKDELPFKVSLSRFELKTYPGTDRPQDFISHIKADGDEVSISMNNIYSRDGYRFYQTSYDDDQKGTFLTVKHDPWGVGVTYTGYALLFVSMILVLFSPKGAFRKILRECMSRGILVLMLACGVSQNISANIRPQLFSSGHVSAPRAITPDDASMFSRKQVVYNGRIVPIRTLALDFCQKVTGKRSFGGLSAEQFMISIMVYPEDWKDIKIIKVEDATLREALGIAGKYGAMTDFFNHDGTYKMNALYQQHKSADDAMEKAILKVDERCALVVMLVNGELIKPVPAGVERPSEALVSIEIFYDAAPWSLILFIVTFILAVVLLVFHSSQFLVHSSQFFEQSSQAFPLPENGETERGAKTIDRARNRHRFRLRFRLRFRSAAFRFCLSILNCATLLITLALLTLYVLRWVIQGHIPLSNGYETMLFIALISSIFATATASKSLFYSHGGTSLLTPLSLIVTAFSLLVSHLSFMSPEMTPLMPVLQSPLLSIHVSVIMMSYTLFAIMTLMSVASLITQSRRRATLHQQTEKLLLICRLLHYPATFLLCAGIFIGAVWANVSWGSYWQWDPKETWALITFMLYAVPLHGNSLPAFRNPRIYHLYVVLAFLSVLITYFGVNYLLGGMHSYA